MARGHLKPLWSLWSSQPSLTIQPEEPRDPPPGMLGGPRRQPAVGLVGKLHQVISRWARVQPAPTLAGKPGQAIMVGKSPCPCHHASLQDLQNNPLVCR